MHGAVATRWAPSGPAAEAFRAVEAAAVGTLEQLQTSEALAEGKVTVVGLDAIADKLGSRWKPRQSLVHDYAERTLRRALGDNGFCQRISETEFIVVQAGVSRLTGQALCINALRDTLTHFLGEAAIGDVILHEVTRITHDGIFGERVNAAAVSEAAGHSREPDAPKPPAVDDRWAPFVASDGRRVRVSCALEPVLQLKAFQRIGYRLVRRVLSLPTETPLTAAEVNNLSIADLERIDFAALSRGLDRLTHDVGDDKQLSLVLPVSYTTLASHRARGKLVDVFHQAKQAVRHGVICEVGGIDGVPPGALRSAIALVKPYSLLIVGHFSEAPSPRLGDLRDGGLQCLAADSPTGLVGEAEFIGWTRGLLRAARPGIRSVMIHRLANSRQAAIAAALGVTHGSFRPREAATEAERIVVVEA